MKLLKKITIVILFFIIIVSVMYKYYLNIYTFNVPLKYSINNIVKFHDKKALQVDKLILESDMDKDYVKDLDDFVQGARLDVQSRPAYKDAYYRGGYPPDNEGVCTDVIWRSFKNAGYDLKAMIDEDIKNNTSKYPRVQNKPDPNIDFRRVKNLIVFFNKYAQVLTTDIKPNDPINLKEWQGGDIVVFDDSYEHIAIVSDIRREDGVPYIIHNGGPYTKEEDALLYWHENLSKIIWHFRFPKIN